MDLNNMKNSDMIGDMFSVAFVTIGGWWRVGLKKGWENCSTPSSVEHMPQRLRVSMHPSEIVSLNGTY